MLDNERILLLKLLITSTRFKLNDVINIKFNIITFNMWWLNKFVFI